MKALTSSGVPAKRLVSWFVTSAFAGWFAVYNVLRALGGDSPHEAALPSILLGGVLGGALVFAGVLGARRWMTARNLVAASDAPGSSVPAPPPGILSALVVTAAVTAAVAVVVGGVLLAQWRSADPAARSATKRADRDVQAQKTVFQRVQIPPHVRDTSQRRRRPFAR